jgi:hypothetical protein
MNLKFVQVYPTSSLPLSKSIMISEGCIKIPTNQSWGSTPDNVGVKIDMKTPLDKVQDLISLALDGGPNQEEARNAAMQAVRLIQKHDLLVGVVPVRKLRRNPEGFSMQKTKKLAEERANQVVSDLVRKSILGDFPMIRATQITDEMHQSGVITQEQKETFYKQLRVCLLAKVRHGVLVSKNGWNGGYQLARSGK